MPKTEREQFVEILTGVMSSPALRHKFGHTFHQEIMTKDFVDITFAIADGVKNELDRRFPKE
jgi:hypothetical protein